MIYINFSFVFSWFNIQFSVFYRNFFFFWFLEFFQCFHSYSVILGVKSKTLFLIIVKLLATKLNDPKLSHNHPLYLSFPKSLTHICRRQTQFATAKHLFGFIRTWALCCALLRRRCSAECKQMLFSLRFARRDVFGRAPHKFITAAVANPIATGPSNWNVNNPFEMLNSSNKVQDK